MEATLELEIVKSYKRLAYTHWHALAEFVDNSTQAYLNNKDLLVSAASNDGDSNFRLKVSIAFDRQSNILRVSDNSIGMDKHDLTSAMKIGMPPADTRGRSRYGLGMKTAACWFGNAWTLKTKKLGHSKAYQIKFDVEKVASGDRDLGLVEEVASAGEHYTVIEISELHRQFAGRTINKIKEYLRSFYRKDIHKYLDLYWNGDKLQWDDFLEIESDLIITSDGPLRKEFEFDIGGKLVKGWAGVFLKGARTKAGFAVLHNDRVVEGWPDSYRPQSIFGEQRNDLVNQRLVGEIDLGAFEISHTKDQILFGTNEEDSLEEKLRLELAQYIVIARGFRKKDATRRFDVNRYVASLSESFSRELTSEAARRVEAIRESDADTQIVFETNKSLCQHIISTTIPDRSIMVNDLGVNLYISSVVDGTEQYILYHETQGDGVPSLGIVINANHPYYEIIGNESELVTFFRHSIYDAFCLWDLSKEIDPILQSRIEHFCLLKDSLLRVPIDFGSGDLSEFLASPGEASE